MKKIIFGLLVALFLLGCNTKKENLTIGYIESSFSHFPLDFSLRFKIIDQETITIKKFTSRQKLQTALNKNKIDIAFMNFTSIWENIRAGEELKIISSLAREGVGIIGSKKNDSLEELNSKKIGFLSDSLTEMLLEMSAEKSELQFEKIDFQSKKKLKNALLASEIDAVCSYVPDIFQFTAEYHIIHWFHNDFKEHPCCDIAAHNLAIKNKKQLIIDFLKDLNKGCDELNKNPNLAFETLALIYDLSPEISKKTIYNTKFVMATGENSKNFQEMVINKMLEKDHLSRKISSSEVYYPILKYAE